MNAHPAKHHRVRRTHLWGRLLPKLHRAPSPPGQLCGFLSLLSAQVGLDLPRLKRLGSRVPLELLEDPTTHALLRRILLLLNILHGDLRGLLWRFGGVLRGQDNRHVLYGPGHADSAASLPDSVPVLGFFSYPHHHLVIIGGAGPGDRPEVPPPQAASRAQPHPLAGVRYQGRLPTEEHQRPHAPSHRIAYA
jgi:hypothetical protein